MTFTDRLRGIISASHPGPLPAPELSPADAADVSSLGGTWLDPDRRSCLVVDCRREAAASHGRDSVGELGDRLERNLDQSALVAGGAHVAGRPVFFDLETTGLSGGAGTYPFLIGCGWFEAGVFTTRQFLLTRLAGERGMLGAVAAEFARAGALVSFNGKSFDAPLLESRYLFHRLRWTASAVPHLDVLHPARRFWRSAGVFDDAASCSLSTLERQVLGARRSGDVAGSQVPERYFRFVRTGDAAPLTAVLEHNRLDLLSLAGLTATLLEMLRLGPDGARTAREALALGHVYERAGRHSCARQAYLRALAMGRAPAGAFDAVKLAALRALAHSWRRTRAFAEAAGCWRQILEVRGCPAALAHEATQALAVHHEHRVRDLEAAETFAQLTLEAGVRPAQAEAARHRLARIRRKLERPPTLSPLLPSSF